MATTAVITSSTKFVGTVADDDPDKKRREAYTVDQFLADVDSRIQTRKITDDKAKIKEALLLVDPDKGDAHGLMISSAFSSFDKYEDFKDMCKLIWKPKIFKDKFFNLQQLRTLKKKGTEFSYAADLRTAVDRVIEDLIQKEKITIVGGGENNQNADIRQVLNYVTFGTMYDSLSEEYQRAFKKLSLDPKQGHIELMDKIMEKANESRIRQNVVAYTETQASTSEQNVEKTLVTQTSHNKSNGNNAQRGSYRGRGMYQSFRGNASNVQRDNQYYSYNNRNSYGNSQRGYSTPHRGRGYHNQSRLECRKCGQSNHKTHECWYCEYCDRYGHKISNCYSKQRDDQRQQNNSQNKSN